jgi:RNA polymerase sigma factor (sigma-70 family)
MLKREGLESPGLGHYLAQIRRLPVLSREQESLLVARIGTDSADPLRRELVRTHLRLVVHVAKRFRNSRLALEDLVAEGNVGLLRAAREFKPHRGVRFMTCAVWWIRKAILEALDRDASLVRMPDHLLRALREARSEPEAPGMGAKPSPQSSKGSRRFRLTPPEVEIFLAMRRPALRLDHGEPGGEGRRPLESLVDEQAPDPHRQLERKEARGRIHRAMSRLVPRERAVLGWRYGLDNGDPRSLEATGRELGVSRERARQVECDAKKKLRHILSRQERRGA